MFHRAVLFRTRPSSEPGHLPNEAFFQILMLFRRRRWMRRFESLKAHRSNVLPAMQFGDSTSRAPTVARYSRSNPPRWFGHTMNKLNEILVSPAANGRSTA
jgi:hypothetical protein